MSFTFILKNEINTTLYFINAFLQYLTLKVLFCIYDLELYMPISPLMRKRIITNCFVSNFVIQIIFFLLVQSHLKEIQAAFISILSDPDGNKDPLIT